jgi:RND family efflux transporter MFP subunit
VRDTLPVDGAFARPEGGTARLAPTVGGTLRAVSVKEGDAVRAGQILAVVDTRVQAAQSAGASLSASAASAQARQAEAALRAAGADQSAAVRLAETGLREAIAERDSEVAAAANALQQLRAGARPQEVAQAEQAVAEARVTRDKALADRDRDRNLLAQGFISGQAARDSAAAYDVAEAALRAAEAQASLVRAGPRAEERRAGELRLRSAREVGEKKIAQAQAALAQARAGRLAVMARVQDVVASRLAASEKAAEAEAARQTVSNAQIRAPFDGTVTRRMLNPGDAADSTTPVLEIAHRQGAPDFVASVAPGDASRLRVGLRVSFPRFPTLSGTVTAVGEADASTSQVPVRVRCSGAARPGAGSFAAALVLLRTLRSVVAVPADAVVTRDEKRVVFVVQGGVARLRSVTTGPTDSGWTAVLAGVARGSTVVRVGQQELSDGAKVAPEADGNSGS